MKLPGLIVVTLALSQFPTSVIAQANPASAITNKAAVEALRRDIDNRLNTFETNYASKLNSLEERSAHSYTLLVSFGTFAGIIVTIVTIMNILRERRHQKDYEEERKSYNGRVEAMDKSRQSDYDRERKFYETTATKQQAMESQRHDAEMKGVSQINKIMIVMEQLFENRKDLEDRFQRALDEMEKKIKEAGEKVEQVLADQLQSQERFSTYEREHKEAARQTWIGLNNTANDLAKTGRHDFKNKHSELSAFKNKFEDFQTTQKIDYPVEDIYLAKFFYLGGLAAHYANDPGSAESLLQKVISFKGPIPAKKGEQGEQGSEQENQKFYNARIAIANYFLGVIALNFGDFSGSVERLNEALKFEVQSGKRDLLTRLVLAEAYAENENYPEAEKLLGEVEAESIIMHRRGGTDAEAAKRHCSRATLMRANLLFRQRPPEWETQARVLLQKVEADDPSYYYAAYTLAQTYAPEAPEAKKAYLRGHDALHKPGELKADGEIRSIILQHMTAAICAYHGADDKLECARLGGIAAGLLAKLPRSNHQECTVFSPLSKTNEAPETIKRHIHLIEEGGFLE